jgi:glycosyltransferase involved in cell wall biosynthesis
MKTERTTSDALSHDFGMQRQEPVTRALLFEGEIRDREQQKSARRETPVSGFDVFLSSFARSLLQYSNRAPVYCTSEAAALSFQRSAPAWLEQAKGKIKLISAYEPSTLQQCEDLVLLSVGPEMLNLAWIRSQLRRPDWPIVAVMHSLSPPPRIRYFLTNVLFNQLQAHDALICATRAARRALENLFLSVPVAARASNRIPFELPVIPFGVDTQEFGTRSKAAARQKLAIPAEQRVILYFGKFSPTDKCDLLPLIIAYSQLPQRHSTTLVLAGDDTQFRMAAALKAAAQELGCGDSVQVLPNVSKDEKLDLFAAADIFVSPSENTQESFSLPIAEAMASGLPVVTSDWAGHDELVEHGKTGFLAPTYLAPISEPLQFITLYSGVYPEKLLGMSTSVEVNYMSRYLQMLLGSSELRQSMGQEGRKRACEKLDLKVVMQQYDELWDELSRRGRKSQPQPNPFECSSFQQVFGHYATAGLQPDNKIQINPAMGPQSAGILDALGRAHYFDAAVFNRIVQILEKEGPKTIAGLVEASNGAKQQTKTAVERHVGRLLKYGLVRLMEEEAPICCGNDASFI